MKLIIFVLLAIILYQSPEARQIVADVFYTIGDFFTPDDLPNSRIVIN
jgi:hypothetical protein